MSTFKVEDMTCGHCEKAIRKEFEKKHPGLKVEVDLGKKTVTAELPDAEVTSLLEEIGYNPKKMS